MPTLKLFSPRLLRESLALKTHLGCRSFLLLATTLVALAAGGCSRQDPFPVTEYINQPKNLGGNNYVLEAEVVSQIKMMSGVGRMIVVHPLKDKTPLAVFIPDSLNANLLVAQRYRFAIKVRDTGLLYVTKLDKI